MLNPSIVFFEAKDIAKIEQKVLLHIKKDDSIPFIFKEKCFAEVKNQVSLKAVYTQVPLKIEGAVVKVLDQAICSKTLSKCLGRSTSAYLFAVSIGSGIDRLIAKYASMSTAECYVVDKIASLYVEEGIEALVDILAQEVKAQHKYLSLRYSAGYGDFDIKNQRLFIEWLDTTKKIGLSLTDSCMLTPIKSVTAIVGIGEEEQPATYPCDGCKLMCKGGECIR